MMRPLTCLCVLAAAGAGLYLYSTKHRTLMLDRHIGDVLQQADAARARTTLLRAEYALLNQPERLSALSGRYLLELRPLAPTQFVQLASLERHLPPVQAFPAPGTPDVPAPPPSPAVTTDGDADAPVGPGAPAAVTPATADSSENAAGHGGDAVPPQRLVEAAVPKPAHKVAASLAAAGHAPAIAAPRPVASHVIATASLRMTAATYSPRAVSPRSYGGDTGGSMLGSETAAMAPPVPVAN